MKLFVDLDGVLTDFDKSLSDLLGKPIKGHGQFGNDPKIWKAIDEAGTYFWKSMDWLPDGKELWNAVKKYDPTILSSPSRHITSKEGKKMWIDENISGTPLILDSKKEKYAKEGYVLIDDRKKNINKWENAGGVGILHKDTGSTIAQLEKLLATPKKSYNVSQFSINRVLQGFTQIGATLDNSSFILGK